MLIQLALAFGTVSMEVLILIFVIECIAKVSVKGISSGISLVLSFLSVVFGTVLALFIQEYTIQSLPIQQ